MSQWKNPVKSSGGFYWILRGNPPPLCIIHVHQIIIFIQLTRYILRLNGIILIMGCIEYNIMKQYAIFYHLQSLSVLHISSKPLHLIDLSHITMKTSLSITRTHISSDHWIFTLDFCTGFYWIFVENKN